MYEGTITVPAHDDSSELQVGLRVTAASFDTGNGGRDTHVLSEDSWTPMGTPSLSSRLPARRAPSTRRQSTARCGSEAISAPLQITVDEFTATGDGVCVQGCTTINRYDVAVTKTKGMTGRVLDMKIDLVAQRAV